MKGLRKKIELPRTFNRCVCPQKNKRQEKEPSNRWYKKQEKKLKTKSSEYPNLEKKIAPDLLALSRT